MDFVTVALIVYCFCREIFFLYTLEKLTNKLMSRNYYDYAISKEVGKETKKPEIKVEDEIPEDLRPLTAVF